MRSCHVYILASHSRALYIGVTNNLIRRLSEHRSRAHDSYTARYAFNHLVYFESSEDIRVVIAREKVIKRWPRSRKFRLVERHNPEWRDLAIDWPVWEPYSGQ